jgi:aminoglycoside phosphotransferase (APT) family kinase protein
MTSIDHGDDGERDRLTRWFAAHLDIPGPLTVELLAGGRSNLTYAVTSPDGRRWALRRPPAGPLRATAHDMHREWRILTALEPTDVPVPTVAGYCDDLAVLGAPFYVMEFVDGIVPDGTASVEALSQEARHRFCENLIDVLISIRQVDFRAVGLADFERPEPLVPRQLRRWAAQIEGADPTVGRLLRQVGDELARRIPPERHRGLVHGDFRPGNVIVGPDGTIRAVLDWELCTVGDTMTDLGWLAAWWSDDDAVGWSPAGLPGFAALPELMSAYAQRSGLPTESANFYDAFARWRLACIAQGVYERYRDGAMRSSAFQDDRLRNQPVALAESALRTLGRAGVR